jgi:hypothetical protein
MSSNRWIHDDASPSNCRGAEAVWSLAPPAVIPVFKISNLKLKYDWLVSKNPTLGGKSIRMTFVPVGVYSPLERGINLTVRLFELMLTGKAPALYLEAEGT